MIVFSATFVPVQNKGFFMKAKRIFCAALLTSLMLPVAEAQVRPVATVSLGIDGADVSGSQNITLIAPFQNSYNSTKHVDTEPVGGIFLGAQFDIVKNWAWQLGLSYFESSSFIASGVVYQFADPAFNNLGYHYQIMSRRLLVENKLLFTFANIWHPFAVVGLGGAKNKAYGYNEYPLASDAIPTPMSFGSNTETSFTYAVGLGIEGDLSDHVRMGVSYRFANLGQASLGTAPGQESTTTISHSSLQTNEILLQMSYLG
jgi:opacity protein-like surface antigen